MFDAIFRSDLSSQIAGSNSTLCSLPYHKASGKEVQTLPYVVRRRFILSNHATPLGKLTGVLNARIGEIHGLTIQNDTISIL
jgi:hypothetical protein